MIVSLDHIAIAVASLEKSIARFTQDLGLVCEGTCKVECQSVNIAMFAMPNTKIELLESASSESPIAKFVKKRGGGIHHLCFRSDDLDDDVSRLKTRGYQFLTEQPFSGANGNRVIFIHPDSFDGVLVELSESNTPDSHDT
jgi:methylmalonyl-CoA/ethylmalonyl-CoA epimerase